MDSLAGSFESGSTILDCELGVLGEIAERVFDVSSTELLSLSREELADIVVVLAAESERLAAVAGRFMALGERGAVSYTKGESTMIGLLNAKGRLSRHRAASIRRGGLAVHRFPSFHTALLAGQITLGHVDVMTKWANKANSDQVQAAEPSLATLATLGTPEQFEYALRCWVAAADPHEHLEEFLEAQARRHLILQPDLFSNVHVTGVLDPLLGEQVMNTITDNAEQLHAGDESLTPAQANHDALIGLVLNPDGEGTVRPHLEVLVPADDSDDGTVHGYHGDTLPAGVDIAEASFKYLLGRPHRASKTPVHSDLGFGSVHYPRTAGGNLIPPAVVRSIAPHSRVRHHRLSRSGGLADDTPAGRHFTVNQRRMIRLRDTHCRHPGCRKPVKQCDYDHLKPWSEGGPTLVANGQLRCRLHHRWKHRHDHGPTTPLTGLFTDGPLFPNRE
ncbi:MAG: DUF222 domain-containing protein [Acidimicrobiales bacterium]|nr:DUF222 domain-containing protein [Acidimicrobiales bacterium]